MTDKKGLGLKSWISGPKEKEVLSDSQQERVGPADKHRVAVLPFVNMSPSAGDEYFADGLTEELISTMSRISGLRVIARTSVMGYKGGQKKISEVSKELGVGTVLEGSVRKSGEKLRINTQLVDAETSEPLWTESYDRELKDVLEIQSEISRMVADALKVRLLLGEKTVIDKRQTINPEAYTLHLKGRFYWNERSEESLNKAIKCFEQSLKLDPSFAPAYSGLADCQIMLAMYGYQRPRSVFPAAKKMAEKALALDDNLAEAHASLAEVYAHYEFDWEKSRRELVKALSLNHGYATAHHWLGVCYFASLGKFSEGLVEARKATEIDPLSPIAATEVARALYLAREYDAAIEQARKSIEFDAGFAPTYEELAFASLQRSRFEDARAAIEEAVTLSKRGMRFLADSGYVYGICGLRDEALGILRELEGLSGKVFVPEYGRALIHLGLGEKDKALDWLLKAYEERGYLTWLKVDPIFDPLRSNSRFTSLLGKLGLA